MVSDFVEVLLYTNQTSLKRYLTNSEIIAVCSDDQKNYSLSDNGYGGILVFNNEISIEDIKSKCCNDSFETAVVIKLLLNKKIETIAFDENGEQTNGKIGKIKNSIAYFIKDPISFSNVVSIIPVERKLVFLQGDSTLNVPTNLIDENCYCPFDCISTDCLEVILSNVKSDNSFNGNVDDFLDDMDDFDINSIDLSSMNEQTISIKDSNNYRNKLLAGLLMLVQGNRPVENKLTANIYSFLEESSSFTEYISKNIYKNIPFDITKYIEKPNEILLRFYKDLKHVACKDNCYSKTLFSSAINALLSLENDDKEQFKTLFLDGIEEQPLKEHADECLSDLRARNRIMLLSEANDDLLSIYALYVFFDYGFDRLNENIIEFGLNGSPFVPILLSLWALKNGMKGVYEEFKKNEIVYACDRKVSSWLGQENNIIPVDTFLLVNKIKVKPDEYIVGNFRCSYINTDIEYEFCVGKSAGQIEKIIDKLEKILSDTFSFQYVDFKQAIKKHRMSKIDIRVYADSIHKKYLSLIKKETPKKKSVAKKQNKEPAEVENFTLFSYLDKEDTNDD
ncbi:MAG: hypothetical protein MR437_04335 [Clostridiales bacterium]|nr:hypothetical protein [Clostridiales bacterium]